MSGSKSRGRRVRPARVRQAVRMDVREVWAGEGDDVEAVQHGVLVDEDTTQNPEMLDQIVILREWSRRRVELDRDIADAVVDARSAGLSWHGVGRGFGLTAEGARRRWGRR